MEHLGKINTLFSIADEFQNSEQRDYNDPMELKQEELQTVEKKELQEGEEPVQAEE